MEITHEQAEQIVMFVGRRIVKCSELLSAFPYMSEDMLAGILQDDYVGNEPNVARWNEARRSISLIRFVQVPKEYKPHYAFSCNDCFELAPAGLNLLYASERRMLRDEKNDRAIEIAEQSRTIALIALASSVIIGIISICVSALR